MTEVLISSSALIIALLVMRKLFRKSLSRRVQYALWALVLIRLLVPVNLPAVNFSVLTAAKPVEEKMTQTITEQPIFVPVTQEPLEEHPLAWKIAPEYTFTSEGESVWIAHTEQETAVQYKRLSPQAVLRWTWIGSSCLAGIFLLFANLRFWLWLRKVRKPYEAEDCKLRVYLIEVGLPSPCLFGLFRPAIYLTPAALDSEESLRHVIAHETTHARHLDHLWTFLRGVCLAMYWFNPLVWAAASASKTDCELACDEGALTRLEETERIPYGKTLLSLIPVRQTVNPLLAATAMSSGKKHLKDRFTRIAKRSKQTVAAVVAAAVLVVAVSACTFTGGNSGKVVVCFDIASGGDYATASYQEAITGFLNWIDDCHKYLGLSISSEDIEVEIIPGSEEEPAARAGALQKVRAEIMAGKGPDVFICKTYSDAFSRYISGGEEFIPIEGGRLFPYVEKSMNSGMFLPLDDLLSELSLADTDDLIPQVMAGGKNQAGEQVILPLSITVPVVMFTGDDLPECNFEGTSWSDVLKGDDPALREMSVWAMSYRKTAFMSDEKSYVRVGDHKSGLSYLFPQVADFEEEKPYFTEEELFQTIKASIDAYRKTLEQETEQNSASVYITDINTHYAGDDQLFFPSVVNTPYTFVPLRNMKGGSTAIATAYCAVNANTKRKDKAREVLDALLCRDHQTGGKLYRIFNGMSVNRNLSGMGSSIAYSGGAEFTGQKLEHWQRVCDDINVVRFLSPLDTELNALMEDVEDAMYTEPNPYNPDYIIRDGKFINYTVTDEEIRAIVSEHYRNMQRLLDES